MATKPHYPHYNVLEAAQDWDAHTREIVEQRMKPAEPLEHLSAEEAKILYQIAATLVDDERSEIIAYVLKHVDNVLGKNIGESQRKPNVPKQSDLIRRTLSSLNKMAHETDGKPFYDLPLPERQTILGQLERGEIANLLWTNLPQKESFTKLLTLTVEAYFSHPIVWSEIGHGGPAYPRGYVRTEIGLVDPWEAKRKE